MNHKKFHNFVTSIAKDDPALAESIVTAHKLIFEPENLTEGLGKTIGNAALGLSLLAPVARAEEFDVQPISQKALEQIYKEYKKNAGSPTFNIEKSPAYADAMYAYLEIKEKYGEREASDFIRALDIQLNKKLGLGVELPEQIDTSTTQL